MKKVEKIFVSITILAMVLRFMLIPGSSELFTIGATVLAILYFYFSFALLNGIRLRQIFKRSSYSNVSGKGVLIAVLVGFSISATITGILFKLLILPGAYEMLTIGLAATGFLIATILLMSSNSNVNFKSFHIRCIPILTLGLILYLTPIDFLISIIYRENPDYVKAAIKSINNPNDLELKSKMQEEWDKIHLSEK